MENYKNKNHGMNTSIRSEQATKKYGSGWQPASIPELSRALSLGWKSPAMIAEENAFAMPLSSRDKIESPDGEQYTIPAGTNNDEWQFGQPTAMRRLAQRLQTPEPVEISSPPPYKGISSKTKTGGNTPA